jgi:integrase
MSKGRSGIRKICGCSRPDRCEHAWYLWVQWKWARSADHPRGRFRFSLDKHFGKHVETRDDAYAAMEVIRLQVKADTFTLGFPDGATPVAVPLEPLTVAPLPAVAVVTVKAYAEDWLRTAALSLKASTHGFYTDHLENHVFPLLGDRPITSIGRSDCRQLITVSREKKLKVSTVAGIVRAFSTVLSQAVEDGHLPANPAHRPGRYLRRGDEPASEPHPFNADEAAHLIDVARESFPDWSAFVLCGLRTGLRLGELLALQWGDCDWHGRYIQVQRNLPRGKLSTPKNHQCRKVDMSPNLRTALRAWRRKQSAAWFKLGLPRPAWVFPSAEGTPLDQSNVRKAFNKILEKAELHQRGPHQLRHSFASLLLQRGAPVTYVSKQLGHRDSAITLRVYSRWLPDSSASKDVDKLDDAPRVATEWQSEGDQRKGKSA